jgi:hypothetical protein
MQPETGDVNIGDSAGGVEPGQNITKLIDMFDNYTARVVV